MAGYSTLKEMFSDNYNFTVTETQCKNIIGFVREYELRKEHPEALNTPYIGLKRIYFLPKDQNFLFDQFTIVKGELKKLIDSVDSINPDFHVIPDPFNQLVIWAIHRTFHSPDLSDRMASRTRYELLKLIQYKFFSSTVNHFYQYGANEEYMTAAIESLSGKFDIKKKETGTWKLIMEKRAQEMLDDNSIHYKALVNFKPDKDVFYVISDTQTRIRNKIKLVNEAYYKTRERGERVQQYNISDEVDGQQLIKSLESKYDQMILHVSRSALSVDQFIDTSSVKLVSGLVRNIEPDVLRKLLMKFNDLAVQQHKSGKSKEQKEGDKYPIYVGYSLLIEKILTASYGAVLRRKDVDVNSKLSILEKTMHHYRASRISDESVLAVKASVMHFVESTGLTKRAETQSGLRLSLILYVILLSFQSF